MSYLSFLWGSPNLYNLLTIISTDMVQTFTVMDLAFDVTDGNQDVLAVRAVHVGGAGQQDHQRDLRQDTPANDAFEVANFSIASVPESSTFALLAAGLGVIGYVMKRRRREEDLRRRERSRRREAPGEETEQPLPVPLRSGAVVYAGAQREKRSRARPPDSAPSDAALPAASSAAASSATSAGGAHLSISAQAK